MPFRTAIRPAGQVQRAASTRAGSNSIPPESLRAAGSVFQLAPGQEIFAQGEASDTLYRVVSGAVRLCKLFKNGRRQIEAFHVTGDVFGFDAHARRSFYAEAVSDCVLISYHRRNIELLAEKDKDVPRQMLHHAVKNLAQAQAHALLLGRRGAAEKLAGFLLDWADRLGQADAFALVMPRQDIADYLGLTIETVSRSLTQLEHRGVIALPNVRQVQILDTAALTKLAS